MARCATRQVVCSVDHAVELNYPASAVFVCVTKDIHFCSAVCQPRAFHISLNVDYFGVSRILLHQFKHTHLKHYFTIHRFPLVVNISIWRSLRFILDVVVACVHFPVSVNAQFRSEGGNEVIIIIIITTLKGGRERRMIYEKVERDGRDVGETEPVTKKGMKEPTLVGTTFL